MNFHRLIMPVAASAAIFTAINAGAATPPSRPTLLDQVVVTATRSEKKLKDVSGSVAVIDRENMDNHMVQDLQDLVRYEPGVDMTEGAREGLSSVNIRGMDGNRVKMTVDGLDLASSFEVHASEGHPTYYIHSGRNFVDPETLQAVEIVKGSASSRYGSGAIGGTVAFRTKNPADLLSTDEDGTGGSVKAGYSSKNKGFTRTVSLANRTGKLESMLIYTRRDNHETRVYKGGSNVLGPARGRANPLTGGLDNALAKVQYQLNDNHRLGLTAAYQRNNNKVEIKDHPIVPNNSRGRDLKERTRVGLFHEWEANQALFDKLRWQLDWQDTSTAMRTFVPAYSFVPRDRINRYRYQEKGYQLEGQFEKSVDFGGFTHNFAYGLNYKNLTLTNNSTRTRLDTGAIRRMDYIPEVASRTAALFVQHEFEPVKALTLRSGVRYDQYTYKPEEHQRTDAVRKPDDSKARKLSGHLAAVYKLNQNLSAFAQFSQGFKAPNLINMYNTIDQRDFGKIVKANPNLKPEESNSFETGLRGSNAYGSFEAAVFLNRYKNFIEDFRSTQPNPGNAYYPTLSIEEKRNISKAQTHGIELKGKLWLDEVVNAPTGLFMRSSLTYVKGKDKTAKRPLNSVTPLKAVLGLGYDDPSETWGGNVDWTLVAAKKKSDISKPEKHFATSGFGIVDLTMYFKPVSSLELRAGIFNLTDKKYRLWNKARKIRAGNASGLTPDNPDRYTQPGRNFKVSAKYTF